MTDNPAVAIGTGETSFASRREFMIVLPGLLLTLIIAMLDQLVVSTALPRIVGDLGGLSHLAWVVTAYVLASTITTPLYGKLGDLYGRKRLLMIAIIIFLIGSALSGLSHTMDQLIAFRALQGLGAGGLMVGAIATIGDMVSPRERGQYMGYMMAAMMLAMIGGPLVGGYITDSLSWRWIFYINMPIGGAALVYLWATMHLPRKRVEHKVDYLGAGVIAIGATAIVLLTTWGGTQYPWGSWQIIMLAAITAASLVAFFVVEGRAVEPVLPLHVFKNRNFSLASSMSFLLGFVMLGALTFLPLYQQTVQHASPTSSGLMLIPLMLGSTVDLADRRPGHQPDRPVQDPADHRRRRHDGRHLPADSPRTAHDAADLGALLRRARRRHGLPDADHLADRAEQRRAEGHGRGQQLARVLPADRRVDGRVGVRRDLHPQLTSVMTARLPGAHVSASAGSLDPATINNLPAVVKDAAFFALSKGLDSVFWWTIPASALVFLLALCVKEIPLRGRNDAPAPQAAVPPEQLEHADLGVSI